MFDKFAIVYHEAAPDIARIATSGKHGPAVLEAILSEMRPDAVYYATTSMTYKQMFPFFNFNEEATERAKVKATSKAVKKAIDSEGLVRLSKGTVGHASVYTFRVYYVTVEERAHGNPTEESSHPSDGVSAPEGMEELPFDAPVVTPDTRETGSYPYSSISIHNHPQGGGTSEEGVNMSKAKKTHGPGPVEWLTYMKQKGYTVDPYEYGKLAMRGFVDANGKPIKDWRAYADSMHRNDRITAVDGPSKKTVACPECGRPVTVTEQDVGTFKGVCTYHDPFFVVETNEQQSS